MNIRNEHRSWKDAIQDTLTTQPKIFYYDGIIELESRCTERIEKPGNYVDK